MFQKQGKVWGLRETKDKEPFSVESRRISIIWHVPFKIDSHPIFGTRPAGAEGPWEFDSIHFDDESVSIWKFNPLLQEEDDKDEDEKRVATTLSLLF